MKHLFKQVKLVKNITFKSVKLMKMFQVTMPSLKYVEQIGKTRNILKIKVL